MRQLEIEPEESVEEDTSPEDGDDEEGNESGAQGSKQTNRQQFSCKQRMDMYAFCVLELEMNGAKVSIKKQQQAIKRVLGKDLSSTSALNQSEKVDDNQNKSESDNLGLSNGSLINTDSDQNGGQNEISADNSATITGEPNKEGQVTEKSKRQRSISKKEAIALAKLQGEAWENRKQYSDIQKLQVLTSAMLRDVQKRFAKYYPDSAVPSRTTIKHVFAKCVSHGTVENIKNPRKSTKIAGGEEIENLLMSKPHLSLRQLARSLSVSTGTVSRRCKALGLIPDSVTLKHQQMALARRQKIKGESSASSRKRKIKANASNTTTSEATTTTAPNPTTTTGTKQARPRAKPRASAAQQPSSLPQAPTTTDYYPPTNQPHSSTYHQSGSADMTAYSTYN